MQQYLNLVKEKEDRWNEQIQECDEILSHANIGTVISIFTCFLNTYQPNNVNELTISLHIVVLQHLLHQDL